MIERVTMYIAKCDHCGEILQDGEIVAWADADEVKSEYNVEISSFDEVNDVDCIIFAVSHKQFSSLNESVISTKFRSDAKEDQRILIDVKGIFDKKVMDTKYNYWRL